MLTLRPSIERGHADHGWLDTYHSFSFNTYHDPAHMGFRALRVINEDRVLGGGGFMPHDHRDMEIVTYVIGGALEHKDSLGSGSIVRRGDVQRMTAGRGVTHSEFNHSRTEPVHLLQIWVFPEAKGLTPGYEQKHFSDTDKTGTLRLIVSPDGRDGSVTWRRPVDLYASILPTGQSVKHALAGDRHGWLQIISGAVTVNGLTVGAGDGVAISREPELTITSAADAEFLLFDLD